MICDKCMEIHRKEISVKPEFKFVSLERYKSTTVRIEDGKFKDPIPTFKLILTVEKTFKNGKTKFINDELIFVSKYCPHCGDKLKAD